MYAWVRYPVKWLYKIFYDFHIEGIENIPQDRPVVLASNHRSYADPVILTMPMKRPVSYMAKEELFRNKLFGWFIRKLGAFPVTRGAGDMSVIDDSINLTLRFGKPIKAEELAVEGSSPRELKEVKKRIMGAITELVEGPALTAADAPLQIEDKNDAAQN